MPGILAQTLLASVEKFCPRSVFWSKQIQNRLEIVPAENGSRNRMALSKALIRRFKSFGKVLHFNKVTLSIVVGLIVQNNKQISKSTNCWMNGLVGCKQRVTLFWIALGYLLVQL